LLSCESFVEFFKTPPAEGILEEHPAAWPPAGGIAVDFHYLCKILALIL